MSEDARGDASRTLRHRAARLLLARLEGRAGLAARARRLRIAAAQRFGLRADPDVVPLLPALFAGAVSEPATLRRYCAQLARLRLLPDDPRLAARSHAFVRGVMALCRHELAAARAAFDEWLMQDRDGEAAGAARLILRWLAVDAEGLAALRPPPRASQFLDMDLFDARRILVVLQHGHMLAGLRALLPPAARLTIVARGEANTAGLEAQIDATAFLDFPHWYGDEGHAQHRALEQAASAAAARVVGLDPRLAGQHYAVTLAIVDHLYMWVALAATAGRHARNARFDRIVVGSPNPSLVATIAAATAAGDRLLVYPPARLASRAHGAPPFWPRAQAVKRAMPGGDGAWRPLSRASRWDADNPPALLLWFLRRPTDHASLRNLVREVAARRGVVVLLQGANSRRRREMARWIAGEASRQGRQAEVVDLDTLLDGAAFTAPGLPASVREAIGAPVVARPGWPTPLARTLDAALRHLFADNGHAMQSLGAIAHVAADLDRRFAGADPAYCLSSPGRLIPFAAAIGHLAARGVPTMDVHGAIHGNSAREFPVPTRYLAVIDSQQQRFLAERWGVEPSRILRAGYVWAERRKARKASAAPEAAVEAVLACPHVLFVGTQPATRAQADGLMEVLVKTVAMLRQGLGIIVKPHPAEPPAAIDRYRAVLAGALAGVPSALLPGRADAALIMRRAGVVLTRTSNIGIEAAAAGVAVVRCPYLEPDVADAFKRVAYACDASSATQAAKLIRALFVKTQVRAALDRKRHRYFGPNPALLHGDGPARIVAFMERDFAQRAALEGGASSAARSPPPVEAAPRA